MDAMQDLGERIRRVRGYTSQEAFARQLGISKGALGCYERGVNCPNVEVILNISRLCHVSLEWLMTGKGNMADTRAPLRATMRQTARHSRPVARPGNCCAAIVPGCGSGWMPWRRNAAT